MPLYETTFIARQDIAPSEVDKLADHYTNIIGEMGGKVVKREYWGLRSLAYIIKKSRKGHYIMLGIDAPFEAIKEVQRLISINEDIIREMTVRVEEITDEPSVIMNQTSKDASPYTGANNEIESEIEE
ncbi:MAG: 30S ribosomal protein S6 [Sphingobacteriia bacterium]|nr:30S ribosomal protein S6 [Sphingobacteriia bacterium]